MIHPQIVATTMYLLSCLLLTLYASDASGTDITRQFPSKDINEIPLGDSATYSIRINSQRPISLGLATVFVSPGQGKLSFHSALKLAEGLAKKGWYVDVVPASWYTIPYESKNAMTDSASMKDSQSMGEKPAMADVAMKDNKSVMHDTKLVEPWMSELEPSVQFDNLSKQMAVLLTGLQHSSDNIRGFRLIVAEGLSAALILSTTHDNTLKQPDAVTLISPFWPSTEVNETIAQLAANYPTPVLDINFASSNRFASNTMLARKVQAGNNFKLDYRQRLIPRLQPRASIEWVGGEIVGWTRSLGW